MNDHNHKTTVSATVIDVANCGPRGGKKFQLCFRSENDQNLTISLASPFSSRSAFGKAFQAVTGIKPHDFGGLDPLALMVGKQCHLLLGREADGGKWQITGVLPLPSLQLEFGLEEVG